MSTTEPVWMDVLRKAVEASSQGAVGERIGYSGSAVSAVLGGKYTASLKAFQKAVEGGLMNSKVRCPVLEDIPQNECLKHQRRPFAATNPRRVALYRACRTGCPHSLAKPAEDEESDS
ncbi:helix-turn-helix domain-containing protein [Hydrocarboniphaga effusa]|uniref:helix-turn-helix domain-containing protein n=1 Tax=Hydrocarboniphaga effusa TaxID=243629 RepID=UPI003BABA0A4